MFGILMERKADNPIAFADALEKMADHPALTQQMGRNVRIMATEQFDRTILSNQFVEFLEQTFVRAKK